MSPAATQPAASSAIVIGGSAGALEGLLPLLEALPDDIAAPIVIVLHISPQRPSRLADLLARHTQRIVREPEDKETLAFGHVYVAPPNYHLLLDEGPAFALSVDAPVHFSRPSIDVLFESAADVLGPRLVGVLLSGANADGALGLQAISAAGGKTIVQDPRQAPNRAMPEAGCRLEPSARVLPIEAMPACLRALTSGADAS